MLAMRLSPVTWFGSLAAGAVGATVAVVLLGGHSAPQQPTYVLHQAAQTGVAVVTSSAPASTGVAPESAAPASTVVVKQPAAVQQENVVTDTTAADTQPAPSQPVPALTPPPLQDHPGNGPSSVNAGSIPTPTTSSDPSHP